MPGHGDEVRIEPDLAEHGGEQDRTVDAIGLRRLNRTVRLVTDIGNDDDGEMLARAASDQPHMTVKGMLLPFRARPHTTIAHMPALLIDPVELHVFGECVDEFDA